MVKTISVVKSSLNYFVPEVFWSEGVFPAAQMLLNIIGTLQAAVCFYDPLTPLRRHVASCHFDHGGATIL